MHVITDPNLKKKMCLPGPVFLNFFLTKLRLAKTTKLINNTQLCISEKIKMHALSISLSNDVFLNSTAYIDY